MLYDVLMKIGNLCYKYFPIIFGLFWGAYAHAESFASAMRLCKKEFTDNPPQITIKYNYGKLKTDHTKTSQQLREIMNKGYNGEPERKLNGLTQLSPYVLVESDIVLSVIGSYNCYYPQKVSVTVGYNPVLYIRNDIQEGSCRYNITLRHEQTHFDIGYLSMEYFLHKLKVSVPKTLENAGVIVKSRKKEKNTRKTLAELNNRYKTQISHIFNRFVQDMMEHQLRIDTAESYDIEGKYCR